MNLRYMTSMLLYLRYRLFCVVVYCCPLSVTAQNLIANGDFESYNACPFTFSAIDYSPGYTSFTHVQDWVRPLDQGTPDYFRNCSTPSSASVPKNFAGFQPAHSGVAYAGIIGYYGFDPDPTKSLRELISTRLTEPMIKDSAYCVKFFVSPSHIPSSTTKAVTLNELGAHFSDTLPYSPTLYQLELPYHILNDTSRHLSDTMLWYEVGGIYIAKGGEEWMTIGCFKRSVFPATTPPTNGKGYSYDYLDDVSVIRTRLQKTVHQIMACDSMKNGSLFLSSSLAAGQYEWSTGERTRSVRISEPGVYACKAFKDCAVFIDSFHVIGEYYDSTHFVSVCDSYKINSVLIAPEAAGRYSWSTGDSTRQILVTKPGDYSVVTVSGCKIISDTFHVVVEVPSLPVIHDTIICQYTPPPKLWVDDTVGLVWFTEPGSIFGSDEQPVIHTEEVRRLTLYVGRRGGDCIGTKVPVTVTIQNKPAAHSPALILRCEGVLDTGLVLGATVTATDVVYAWSTGETTCCINPGKDDRYIRTATNFCGQAVDTFVLRSVPCDRCLIFPTAFTPNNDHRNDGFGALIRCPVAAFRLNIYNRWGSLVYSTRNKDDHWDGNWKGAAAPAGTYMYMATMVHAVTGKETLEKGAVTLIR